MECPQCGGPMWDNRNNKRNPKAPDYKCKNANCIDPQTGRTSAVWEQRTSRPAQPPMQYDQYGNPIQPAPYRAPAPAQRPQAARPAPAPAALQEKREMVMSYAKDVIVAQIAAGQGPETPVKSIIMAYRLMLKEVRQPGSIIFKGDQEQPAPEADPNPDDLNSTFPPDEEQA